MNRSMNDVEREIEESRARLDRTIDRLQEKLTVSGAIDETLGGIRKSRYGGSVERALETVRNNPVPVLVALAGIGWLLRRYAGEPVPGEPVRPRRPQPYPSRSPSRGPLRRDTGFIGDEDIDPDLAATGGPEIRPRSASTRQPDTTGSGPRPPRPAPARGDV